jgi:hypothetical protein
LRPEETGGLFEKHPPARPKQSVQPCKQPTNTAQAILNVSGSFEDDHAMITLVRIFEGMITLGPV